jgi:phosphoglycerol transferase MdoB-like AlkP superfamily enzyme
MALRAMQSRVPSRPAGWQTWLRWWGLFLLLSSALRALLWWRIGGQAPISFGTAVQVLGRGLMFDALAGASLLWPLALYLALSPAAWWARRWWRALTACGLAAWLMLMLFICTAEWLFWDEFGTRFNFIAVDYLLYTHEVVGNIRESYPVGKLLGLMALVSVGGVCLGWRVLMPAAASGAKGRLTWGLPVLIGTLLVPGHLAVHAGLKQHADNRYLNDLSGDGVYEFFAALRHNELDFEHFYQSLPAEDALARLRRQLATPHARLRNRGPDDLTRLVDYGAPERHLNVVLISVESLSADFMAAFGNRDGLTPRLDRLAREGLLFTRLYATGTRTVRGLEALSLAVPPTPGQSIVKRPHNEGMFSLGSVFKDKGYDTRYVYGGYGYFDNMNAFFSANSYEVVDRMAIPAAAIHHENIWGVADEDLFTLVLQQADVSHAKGRPSFMHVMTTSNHRPFTYPDGRIDIPSHTGRAGGVKYTDWAIGRFIDEAAKRPWFRDTVFVIVADHCAASAGKTDLPLERYHIPAIVYAPAHIEPKQIDRLASQIDIAPTLLGLLNFRYESRFLGYDLFDLEPGRERAFISTYQDLGVVREGVLVRLDPRGGVRSTRVEQGRSLPEPVSAPWDTVADAISWYQGAAWAYHHDGLKVDERVADGHADPVGGG